MSTPGDGDAARTYLGASGEIVVEALQKPNTSGYWSGVSNGYSISSYSPSFWGGIQDDVRAEFNYVTAPGYNLRDSAYQDIGNGSYLTGSLKYVGSVGWRTLSTAFELPANLLLSSARGRGFQPAPVDRQDVGPILFAAGGIEAMSSGLGRLGVAAGSDIPTIAFSRARTPGIADNIEAAIADGHPSVLNRLEAQDLIRANRRDALRGQPSPALNHSLDEYPFASSIQGGAGSRVSAVPVTEQNIQGGLLSSFYQTNNIRAGDPFRVLVVP